MSAICCIFGAGEYCDRDLAEFLPPEAYVIAADGGYLPLKQRGIVPNLLVGDFDSLAEIPEGIELIRHPVMKDDTDLMLAIREGLRRGFRNFRIYGALGGRLDHTVASLQSLVYLAERGGCGVLLGGDQRIGVLRNGSLYFPSGYTGTISVFCMGEPAEGVSLQGLLYPLQDAQLTAGFPLGVSNSFLGEPARVSVRQGTLLVFWTAPAGAKLPEWQV